MMWISVKKFQKNIIGKVVPVPNLLNIMPSRCMGE